MPRISRRGRAIAAISGLAIGVATVGVALPAAADPADATQSAPTAPRAASSHTVTLLTGDKVHVSEHADGSKAVEIDTAVEGAVVETATLGGELHVLPRAAMPSSPPACSMPTLQVSRLIEYGYDDASVAATPLILEYSDGASTFSAPCPASRSEPRSRASTARPLPPTTRPPRRPGAP